MSLRHIGPSPFVDFFRQVAPYVHRHRGKTFVIMFGGEAAQDAHFPHFVHDIALLHSLGIKVVLVHGSRPQIQRRLKEQGISAQFVGHDRVTDERTMRLVREAVGSLRMRIEGLLSTGLSSSPMAGAKLRVVTGNFILAQPAGVKNGIDYMYTGDVRKVDVEGIEDCLKDGSLVLISPLGYSTTGESFNLSSHQVAEKVASSLKASKLIALTEGGKVQDKKKKDIHQLSPQDALLVAKNKELSPDVIKHLKHGALACANGVRRVHLVESRVDGAILQELFTREGQGTLITSDVFEGIRKATLADVGGIVNLIHPLEEAGVLIRRGKEKIETEIDQFFVVERDGLVIGCAAIERFGEDLAEIYCVAVHPKYQRTGRGEELMDDIEEELVRMGVKKSFVFTTRTTHWFIERGYATWSLQHLPKERKKTYDKSRKSKVLVKTLS